MKLSLLNKNNIIFFCIIGLLLISILFTTPFLRYPYDMFQNLIIINKFHTSLIYTNVIETGRIWIEHNTLGIGTISDTHIVIPDKAYIWQYLWAKIFYLINIDNHQLFVQAKIIHVTQIYISLFSLYYFSKVIIRNTYKDIKQITLKYLSLWSVIIWLSIFATFSVIYHQVWVMWYSVNYQITLPLFWYITGLTISLILEEYSPFQKIFFILQILLISFFILQAHSMEFMYYLMYLLVFTIVYIDMIWKITKKYYYLLITISAIIIYFIKYYQPETSRIFNYLSIEKIPELYHIIMEEGKLLISGYNRASSSINELMYFILFISIFFIISLLWDKYKYNHININTRMILFLMLSSMFVMIPLYQFTGGLFSVVSKMLVVNRLYYSSSLFVLLPIFIYYFIRKKNLHFAYINLILLFILSTTYIFSKYNSVLTHNYYKNIQSIKDSFTKNKIGFNLSREQIDEIGRELQKYENDNDINSTICYYSRTDIAFVIKFIYDKNVYWEGRRFTPNYKTIYHKSKNSQCTKHILFKIPNDFPKYIPYR